jgi:hypothetical protein
MRGGSKPGERRGGRQKGTPNKRTLAEKEALAASGLTPLQHMLNVLRDPDAPPERRDAMAKAAAPYCHRALKSVEHTGEGGGPIQYKVTLSFD